MKEFSGKVVSVQPLTHDIRLLEIELDAPMRFWSGQYVDLTISLVRNDARLLDGQQVGWLEPPELHHQEISGRRLLEETRRRTGAGARGRRQRPLRHLLSPRRAARAHAAQLAVARACPPLRSILACHLASGEQRPIRFFYGARTKADLFLLDEFADIGRRARRDFKFIPALSHEADGAWDGERGFIHEVVARHLREENLGDGADAYSCGPPPMIDAVLPVLQMAGLEPDRIYFDKFTQPSR